MINRVVLVGHLGKKPELKEITAGVYTDLSLATDSSFKDKEGKKVRKSDWHTVRVWNDSARSCVQYLGKGSLVFVEGRIEYSQWTDNDGVKHYRTIIQANRVRFLDRKQAEEPAPATEAASAAVTPSEEFNPDYPF